MVGLQHSKPPRTQLIGLPHQYAHLKKRCQFVIDRTRCLHWVRLTVVTPPNGFVTVLLQMRNHPYLSSARLKCACKLYLSWDFSSYIGDFLVQRMYLINSVPLANRQSYEKFNSTEVRLVFKHSVMYSEPYMLSWLRLLSDLYSLLKFLRSKGRWDSFSYASVS